MMQQVQPKSAATRGRCHNRPFIELTYSQGWNIALYRFAGSADAAHRRAMGNGPCSLVHYPPQP